MNAGTRHGEISEIIKSVEIVDATGGQRLQDVSLEDFSYRKNHFLSTKDRNHLSLYYEKRQKIHKFIKQ